MTNRAGEVEYSGLSSRERAVMEAVAHGRGAFGWYRIESYLADRVSPRTPVLAVVLDTLHARGLVRDRLRDNGKRLWALTARGYEALAG